MTIKTTHEIPMNNYNSNAAFLSNYICERCLLLGLGVVCKVVTTTSVVIYFSGPQITQNFKKISFT